METKIKLFSVFLHITLNVILNVIIFTTCIITIVVCATQITIFSLSTLNHNYNKVFIGIIFLLISIFIMYKTIKRSNEVRNIIKNFINKNQKVENETLSKNTFETLIYLTCTIFIFLIFI